MGFKRVLIANRGEIALRILRTLRDMGIEAAIIHGKEDRLSLPVMMSDVAYPNYRANPLDSYLDIESVITAAKELQCDAVHPGYGFLAENSHFVKRLTEEGITFIGPSSEVISLLGDKIEARAAMEAAGLPVARGSSEPISDAKVADALAKEIGYPVIIKAAAGGGGIGMQIVEEESQFASALKLCMSRAKSAFGDERVFVEKYIQGAQHVEFQVLGDGKNAIHFGERFCSIQRRHQKLVEEGPWLSDEAMEHELEAFSNLAKEGLLPDEKVRQLEETTRRRKAIIEQNQQELAENDGQFSWQELIDSEEHHSSTAGKGGLPRIDL